MANRYWVGGSGKWSEENLHWSTSSGGAAGGTRGSDIITNGTFTGSASGWSLLGGWSYGGNKVTCTPNAASFLSQSGLSFVTNAWYEIAFTISGRTAGGIALNIGVTYSIFYSANGTYTILLQGSGSVLTIAGDSSFDGSLDNISVKPYTSILPTTSDNCIFDSSSGLSGATVDMDLSSFAAYPTCRDFSSLVGAPYTILPSGRQLKVYGSLILENSITVDDSSTSLYVEFYATSSKTITSNGAVLGTSGQQGVSFDFYGLAGTWTLQDDLHLRGDFGEIYIENGTFDANGHNIIANDLWCLADTGLTPTVNMGSGTWELTGDDSTEGSFIAIDEIGDVVTINAATSTIKVTNASSNTKTLAMYDSGVGKTFHNIWFTGAGTGNFIIQGSNIFNDFKVDTPPHTIIFTNGTNTTVTSFTVTGTSGNLITLDSDTTATHTLTKTEGGTISCDYLNIQHSIANPVDTWYAGKFSTDNQSTPTAGSGWIFSGTPTVWINEIPYGGATGSTYDGNDKTDGLNTWDSSADSYDGQTITIWTNETKS